MSIKVASKADIVTATLRGGQKEWRKPLSLVLFGA
jgi:hypothetical protein